MRAGKDRNLKKDDRNKALVSIILTYLRPEMKNAIQYTHILIDTFYSFFLSHNLTYSYLSR
jgi:hypothetical protein